MTLLLPASGTLNSSTRLIIRKTSAESTQIGMPPFLLRLRLSLPAPMPWSTFVTLFLKESAM